MKTTEIGKIVFDPPNRTKKHERQDIWKNTVIIQMQGDLCAYYRWFIERRFGIKLDKPLRGVHMIIINDRISEGCSESYKRTRAKWNGKKVKVDYNVWRTETDGKHWWLSAFSDVAPLIRKECGFPEKYYYGFHITLGKVKDKDLHLMPYIMKNLKRYIL
jgi:hypothetical protein